MLWDADSFPDGTWDYECGLREGCLFAWDGLYGFPTENGTSKMTALVSDGLSVVQMK